MNRRFEITDDESARLEPLLPSTEPRRGGRFRDHRQVLNGILFRTRSGIPWRDLPERYGPWDTAYKRFARWQADGAWARVEACLRTQADAAGELDWEAQIDSTVVRVHQHAAGAPQRGLTADAAARQQALGRSRGGLTTKLHTICDGRGRNLATRLTPGKPPIPASSSGWSTRCGLLLPAAEASVEGYTRFRSGRRHQARRSWPWRVQQNLSLAIKPSSG